MQINLILKIKHTIIILYFSIQYGIAQEIQSQQYTYKGNCKNQVLKRTYLEDNVFIDSTYYNKGDITELMTTDTFKIINKNWYLKEQGKWKRYFSKKDFRKKKSIPLYDFLPENQQCTGSIRPFVETKVGKKIIYIYTVGATDLDTSGITFYYVDLDFGIIKIKDTRQEDDCQIIELLHP
jgi:hypothetical protein